MTEPATPASTLALDDAAIIEIVLAVAATEQGGALATTHAEDGTPYVTFVLFTLRPDGRVLFSSADNRQHSRNMAATPEVSFLIDNRDVVVRGDWSKFRRVVIEGRAEPIPGGDPRYPGYLGDIAAKSDLARDLAERSQVYCIHPRRLILMQGSDPARHIVDFDDPGAWGETTLP